MAPFMYVCTICMNKGHASKNAKVRFYVNLYGVSDALQASPRPCQNSDPKTEPFDFPADLMIPRTQIPKLSQLLSQQT